MSENCVITINRQLGTYGSYIGKKIAERLDIFYADRAIIEGAAKQLSVSEEEVVRQEETAPSFWRMLINSVQVSPDHYAPAMVAVPTDYKFHIAETSVIKKIVAERSAVVIGRCGFHILRDHPKRISIFLYADFKFRVENYAKQYNISIEEAEKIVEKGDKARIHYCRNFTGYEYTDAQNYDLCIDTSRLDSQDAAVDFILAYIKARNF